MQIIIHEARFNQIVSHVFYFKIKSIFYFKIKSSLKFFLISAKFIFRTVSSLDIFASDSNIFFFAEKACHISLFFLKENTITSKTNSLSETKY